MSLGLRRCFATAPTWARSSSRDTWHDRSHRRRTAPPSNRRTWRKPSATPLRPSANANFPSSTRVRFLVAPPPLIARRLREAGHDAVHTSDLDMEQASDAGVVLQARAKDERLSRRIPTSAPFSLRAALPAPSFILFRRTEDRSADRELRPLLANLPAVEGALGEGAIVVFDADRVRVRPLPIL